MKHHPMNESELSEQRRKISVRLIEDLSNLVDDWNLSEKEQISFLGGYTVYSLKAHFCKEKSAMLSESLTERIVLLTSINQDLKKIFPNENDLRDALKSSKLFGNTDAMTSIVECDVKEFHKPGLQFLKPLPCL